MTRREAIIEVIKAFEDCLAKLEDTKRVLEALGVTQDEFEKANKELG